jgi:hypothetical protein
MELQARQVIAGVLTPPPGGPGGIDVNASKINQIWSEVSPHYGYRQFQLAPDGTGAVFLGASESDAVTIQPPLIQVRDVVSFTVGQSADKVQAIFSAISRHLGIAQFFNFGCKLVYHAPMPDNDSASFMLRALGRNQDDLAELRAGDHLWGGMKIGTGGGDRQYVLVLEPFHADRRSLYVDVDAQFPGPMTLDAVPGRIKDVEQYVTHAVNAFLDRLGG